MEEKPRSKGSLVPGVIVFLKAVFLPVTFPVLLCCSELLSS